MKKKIVSYEEVTISQELRDKCIEFLKNTSRDMYWDYQDKLSLEQVDKAMKDKNGEGFNNLENEIWENNIDVIYEYECEILKELQEKFEELEGFEISELREEFLDYLNVNFNINDLIRHTTDIRVRVVIHSNYEGCSYDDKEGDYIKQIKRLLKGKYEEKSFNQELDNIMSCCNQFIFYCEMNAKDLKEIAENPQWKKIIIPKEAWGGFYDSWNGSGSVLEVKLLEDIVLKRQHGKTEYDNIEIVIDEVNKYSVENVYGLCNVPEVKIVVK